MPFTYFNFLLNHFIEIMLLISNLMWHAIEYYKDSHDKLSHLVSISSHNINDPKPPQQKYTRERLEADTALPGAPAGPLGQAACNSEN